MKYNFQVVCLDRSDYIIEYKNFSIPELRQMEEYIGTMCTSIEVNTIKITRWNDKGERV